MQIIVVKRQPFWTRERILISLMIIAVLMIFTILYGEIRRDKPSHMLQSALQEMHEYHAKMDIQIMEIGDEHTLSFEGVKLGGKVLRGHLPEYDLDVYLNHRGELFVKDLFDGAWKKAGDLELDALKGFLSMPFALLEQSMEQLNGATLIQHNNNRHLIRMSIPPEVLPDYMIYTDGLLLECELYIEEDTFFIPEVSFYLFDDLDNREILRRTFIFEVTTLAKTETKNKLPYLPSLLHHLE